MVHLSQVPNAAAADAQIVEGLDKADFFAPDEEDGVHASVYGSRYAAADLPRTEMPEKEMPRDVAYRMIKYAFLPSICSCVLMPISLVAADCVKCHS